MRRLFTLLLLAPACIGFGQSDVSKLGTTQANGLYHGVNLVASTSGDTTTASANVTKLQTALTAGGVNIVSISGGTVAYINSTLTIPSYTELNVPKGLTIRAMAATGNMLQNAAVTRSWNTLYNNSGTITTGPLSMIRAADVPAWTVNTAYVQGNYVYDPTSTNIYWMSAASGTSAASGNGPSGTGTGISDGTCTWNYVTTWKPPTPSSALNYAMINWPSHGLSVGNSIHVTPQPDNGTTNYWSASQTAHTRGGPCDTAFFGVFNVTAVNDSNWFTVLLWRPPAAAFSGIPVNIRLADQSIKLSGGGTWDYNSSTNSGTGVGNMCINICGVSRFWVEGAEVTNSAKYNLNLAGVAYADVAHFDTGPVGSFSDRVKVYGPAWMVKIHDAAGSDGDDIVSIEPAEDLAYASYTQAVGDCINIQVDNITSDAGSGVVVYPSKSPVSAVVDQIEVSRIYINNANSVAVSIVGTGATTSAAMGLLYMHDIDLRQCAGTLFTCTNASGNSAYSVDAITIKRCFSGNTLNTNNSKLVSFGIAGAAPWTVGVLDISECDVYPYSAMVGSGGTSGVSINTCNIHKCNINQQTATGYIAQFAGSSSALIGALNIYGNQITSVGAVYATSGACIIDVMNIYGNDVTFNSTSNSYLVYANSSSQPIKKLNIRDNNLISNPKAVIQDAYGMDISFTGNYYPNGAVVCTATVSNRMYVANNNISGASYGFIRFNAASITCTLTSGGGNLVYSNTWVTRPSAGLLIPYGFDIQDDITKWTRTSGAFGFNTNTSPGSGTLTTAGPVMCQGTSSGSWFALYSPLTQTY